MSDNNNDYDDTVANTMSSSKRQRVDEEGTGVLVTTTTSTSEQQQKPTTAALRASSLPSPTLQLSGHGGSIYALEYSPNGMTLCSASFDKTLFLWSHANEEDYYNTGDDDDDIYNPFQNNNSNNNKYENFNVLRGHKNAVLDCHWMDNETVVSASADKTVMLWDAYTGQRLRKWEPQQQSSSSGSIVNTCTIVSPHVAAAAGDDGTCMIWDRRQKRPATVLPQCSDYPILALCAAGGDNATVMTHDQLFCSGIDSNITCWDLKMQRKVYAMTGHVDTVTCLSLHPDGGTHLLSNSMDSTCKIWDIRPYVSSNQEGRRQVKEFRGHVHSAEKGILKCAWSADGNFITAGSADGCVHVWDEFTTQELFVLPGHQGCVNTVVFHPVEANVIASGSSDKQILVGELTM